uniref:Uncharacterized protein n=1 Tax=Anguilla anguilla TaxID=7936 RepID=A0A0E9U6J9_ANGAN
MVGNLFIFYKFGFKYNKLLEQGHCNKNPPDYQVMLKTACFTRFT